MSNIKRVMCSKCSKRTYKFPKCAYFSMICQENIKNCGSTHNPFKALRRNTKTAGTSQSSEIYSPPISLGVACLGCSMNVRLRSWSCYKSYTTSRTPSSTTCITMTGLNVPWRRVSTHFRRGVCGLMFSQLKQFCVDREVPTRSRLVWSTAGYNACTSI